MTMNDLQLHSTLYINIKLSERNHKRVFTARFHLCKVQKQAQLNDIVGTFGEGGVTERDTVGASGMSVCFLIRLLVK